MKNNKLLQLGHKIKFERAKQNISQEELAEKAQMSRRAITSIECGVSDVRYTNLIQISEALGLKISDLLDFRL